MSYRLFNSIEFERYLWWKIVNLDRIFLFITINFSSINQWFQKHVCHWDIRMFNSFRTRHLEVCYKKSALKNFAKFTGKHLRRSLHTCNIVKRETPAQVFSCEFCKIFKNTFFTEHLQMAASVLPLLTCIFCIFLLADFNQ